MLSEGWHWVHWAGWPGCTLALLVFVVLPLLSRPVQAIAELGAATPTPTSDWPCSTIFIWKTKSWWSPRSVGMNYSVCVLGAVINCEGLSLCVVMWGRYRLGAESACAAWAGGWCSVREQPGREWDQSEERWHNWHKHIPHNTFIGEGGEHQARTSLAKLSYIPPARLKRFGKSSGTIWQTCCGQRTNTKPQQVKTVNKQLTRSSESSQLLIELDNMSLLTFLMQGKAAMAAAGGTLNICLECVGWGDTTLFLCRHRAVKVDCGMDHSRD